MQRQKGSIREHRFVVFPHPQGKGCSLVMFSFPLVQAKAKKPLFVQFVLENMWAVYDAVVLHR